jgi:hypothetical protein
MVVVVIVAGVAGAIGEHYGGLLSYPPSSNNTNSPLTLYETVMTTSVLTYVQIIASPTTVTAAATFPRQVEVKGSIYSEGYDPLDVYFEHCLPAAFVACETYPATMSDLKNSTLTIGDLAHVYYAGSYSVIVPNNESFGVSVRLAYSSGSYLTALAVLPLSALTPVVGSYNIDCFFPGSNHNLSNIQCVSD